MPTSDPLSAETLARMKAEHTERFSDGHCGRCCLCPSVAAECSPCDAALLLAELERVQSPAVLEKMWWNGFSPRVRGTAVWADDDSDIVSDTVTTIPVVWCHCGAEGMEEVHPRHLERWQDEDQLTGYDQGIHAGLLGPVTSEELP